MTQTRKPIGLSFAALLALAPAAHAQEQAQSADSFVDSIGINAAIYSDLSNYTGIKNAVVGLGIRHLRYTPPNAQTAQDLAQSGIKCLYLADVGDFTNGTINTIYGIRDAIKADNAPLQAIDAVEGPNEPDFYWEPQSGYGSKSYNGQGYQQGISGIVAGTTAFMQDLHSVLKGDSATAGLPIIGLSFPHYYTPGQNPWPQGSLYAYVDYGCMHPYACQINAFCPQQAYDTVSPYFWNTDQPSDNIDEYPIAFDAFQTPYTDSSGHKKPMYATETGWVTGTGKGMISRAVQAKYIPRLFAEYFRTNVQTRPGVGIARTYLFKVADDSDAGNAWGLLDSGLNQKPAYTALKSLIALLKEPGASFTPGSLNYSLSVSPVDNYTEPGSGQTVNYDRTQYLHHLLLQKSNGDYYLALWHEVSDDDVSVTPTRQITPPALPTTVTLPSGITNVTEYAYDSNWNFQPTALALSSGKVSLNVPDQIVVLKLSAVNTLFQTGFESGDPQPSWTNTPDNDNWTPGTNPANVSGYISSVGPECGVRSGNDSGLASGPHAGSQMLMAAGTANNGGGADFVYFKAFDLSANPVSIQSSSTISYWIEPYNDNGRYVAVDFHCTDGTTLRDSGIKDQNGASVHPNAGHGGSIPLGQWSQITASLASLAGKTIDRIWIAYDRPNSTGQFRAYIDDLVIDPPAPKARRSAPKARRMTRTRH